MKFNAVLNDFTAGEWSPKMYGRSNTEQYFKACRTFKNFMARIQGGAYKRPGTKLLATDIEATYASVTYNVADIMEAAGDLRIFSFTLSDGSENTLIITDTESDDATTPWVVLTGLTTTGVTRLRGVVPYTSGSADQVAFNLNTLNIRQVGDLIVLSDGTRAPAIIRRLTDGTNRFEMLGVSFWYLLGGESATERYKAFPYQLPEANGSSATLTITGASFAVGATVTVTSSAALFTSTMASSGDNIGQYFKVTAAGYTGAFYVSGFTSSTSVSAILVTSFTSLGTSPLAVGAAAGTSWEIASWSTARGWPTVSTFYQGALYFGRSTTYPDTFWRSRIGNIFQFMEIPDADDTGFSTYTDDNTRPWTFTPNTDQVGAIQAMSSGKSLLVLMDNSEIVLRGTNGALGPNDFDAESSTYYGSERIQPARVGSFVTFVQKGGRLRDMTFSFDEFQYKSADLSFTSDHLGTISKIVSAEFGSSMLFAVTEEGGLISCTLERDYQITAWSELEFGGDGGVAPTVLDVSVVDKSKVRVLLERDVDGTTRYTIEEIEPFYEGPDDITDTSVNVSTGFMPYLYMDMSRSIAKTALGLPASDTFDFNDTFYKNATVHVFGRPYTNGNTRGHIYLGEYTANANGELIAPEFELYDVLTIGFNYEAKIIPMSIEQGAQYGSPVGKQRRVNDMFFRFYKSLGVKYGNAREGLYHIPMRLDSVSPDAASPLLTTTYYKKFPLGTDRDYEIIIESTGPFPVNVLAIGMEGFTYD